MRPETTAGSAGAGRHAILVTAGAVDGYPPVQHQARLLAQAGFAVEIVTPLLAGKAAVSFACPGVRVTPISSDDSKLGKALRYVRFCVAIARARRRAGPDVVEIAYDPLGMLYSDIAPFRPRFRIAHFHEMLQQFGAVWQETRLGRAITHYQLAVTADDARSDVLRRQLKLAQTPVLTVQNYPLRSTIDLPSIPDKETFDVVYAGALGSTQKLDLIVESVPLWPSDTTFTILGRADSAFAMSLKQRAESLAPGRIRFSGWVDYTTLESHLAAADLGILFLDPSFEQYRTALGASNKRYQYMQAGLPQIGDMNPGLPALLEDNGIGLCVRDYTPASVAAAVAAYSQDRNRRNVEGARARDLHLERFHYERAFAPLLEAIETRLAQATASHRFVTREA